jgi:hypothetical protein
MTATGPRRLDEVANSGQLGPNAGLIIRIVALRNFNSPGVGLGR